MTKHLTENIALAVATAGAAFFLANACTAGIRSSYPVATTQHSLIPAHTTTTPDPYPDCGPACHAPEAEADVTRIQHTAGPEFTCWAEDNPQMPHGYEIICRHTPTNPQPRTTP